MVSGLLIGLNAHFDQRIQYETMAQKKDLNQ